MVRPTVQVRLSESIDGLPDDGSMSKLPPSTAAKAPNLPTCCLPACTRPSASVRNCASRVRSGTSASSDSACGPSIMETSKSPTIPEAAVVGCTPSA
jgi:hypothetical protein